MVIIVSGRVEGSILVILNQAINFSRIYHPGYRKPNHQLNLNHVKKLKVYLEVFYVHRPICGVMAIKIHLELMRLHKKEGVIMYVL